jgi:hypothetical protein
MFEQWPDTVGVGARKALLLHLFQIVIIPVINIIASSSNTRLPLAMWAITGWGLTQLLYMVPAIVIAVRAGQKQIAKGVVIVAAIGMLLNGACDAALFR